MNSWNAMQYEGKETILRVVHREAEQFLELVGSDDVWQQPTGAGHWQVRDIVAHLVDTTESYFIAFDAARSHAQIDAAYGLPGMASRANDRAMSLRTEPRPGLVERLDADLSKIMQIFEALGPEDWTGLMVPHFYMGLLPAHFYPAFQLMDYAVHSWDIRQGTGRSHGFSGDAADLLTPYMFVLWKYTTALEEGADACELGIRITSGPNAGDTRVTVGPEGLNYESGDVSGLETCLEFDPGSFVLTAFGRCNAGTIRGDRALADRYLNMFFRI